MQKGTTDKQLPLKRTLFFRFLDFLRGTATAVFRRKQIESNLGKRKAAAAMGSVKKNAAMLGLPDAVFDLAMGI